MVMVATAMPWDTTEFDVTVTLAGAGTTVIGITLIGRSAVEREDAAAKLLAQQKELDELREKQRISDAEAEVLRKQRAEEDRLRLKKQQEDLDQQRHDIEAQQRQQRERDAQYQRDQEELARLRAQAAAPAATTSVIAPAITEKVEVAPLGEHAAAAESDDVTVDAPPVEDIVEVVALGFDVDLDTARAWLHAIRF
jgi:membrane protein involved in colicin uptake